MAEWEALEMLCMTCSYRGFESLSLRHINMKNIYKEIYNLAKPYYLEGRPMDIDHIEWMMEVTEIVSKTDNLDDTILMPLVILHDVGYAEVPKDNPFNLNIRKLHMEAGANIARDILNKLNYPKEKTEEIVYYISVHDNWSFRENKIYREFPLLGIFTDLDFMWMASPKGFEALKGILKKNSEEMIKYLENNEKLKSRPFVSKTAKKIFEKYLVDLKG